MNKFESKYFNTAIVMDEALIELLEKKEYDYITVKEVCEKAGVNRSTFYLHYENMDELLAETIKYLNSKFTAQFSNTAFAQSKLKDLSHEQKMFITPEYLSPLFSFMKENKKVLRLYKKIPNVMNTEKTFADIRSNILNTILTEFNVPESYQKYYISFYMEGFFAIIFTWLDNDCKESIEEMISICITVLNLKDYKAK